MIMEIGITAGEIWHFLEKQKNERAKLKDLIKGIKRTEELTLMSLGWLAREGHVFISCGPEGFEAALLKQE
ncbi:MAG: winged helix-turn-helix domain-containing protein [Candidatus Omnitrophica bacterium]|nr:winged helix-turn-helix domain-containing protein [Candidatus Omnitrophota bacterium]